MTEALLTYSKSYFIKKIGYVNSNKKPVFHVIPIFTLIFIFQYY